MNLKSIENFEDDQNDEQTVNSPRSLQACRQLAILPQDLIKKSKEALIQSFNIKQKLSNETLQQFLQHYEEQRKQKIRQVLDLRKIIIASQYKKDIQEQKKQKQENVYKFASQILTTRELNNDYQQIMKQLDLMNDQESFFKNSVKTHQNYREHILKSQNKAEQKQKRVKQEQYQNTTKTNELSQNISKIQFHSLNDSSSNHELKNVIHKYSSLILEEERKQKEIGLRKWINISQDVKNYSIKELPQIIIQQEKKNNNSYYIEQRNKQRLDIQKQKSLNLQQKIKQQQEEIDQIQINRIKEIQQNLYNLKNQQILNQKQQYEKDYQKQLNLFNTKSLINQKQNSEPSLITKNISKTPKAERIDTIDRYLMYLPKSTQKSTNFQILNLNSSSINKQNKTVII